MVEKLEITIEVILHATEDIKKIFDAFSEFFEINEKVFAVEELTGHFNNPITIIRAKITKKQSKKFFEKLISEIPKEQINDLIDNLENRIQNSNLHLRIGKQEFVNRQITMQEEDPVKLKIFTPIYKKKEIIETYSNLLRPT